MGEFHLQAHVVKEDIRGYTKHPPQVLPTPQRAVTVRQYCPPGGHKEIGATIAERQKWTLYILHSPFSSSMWAVWKPDGSWWMTVDYRELNKVVPPRHAAVPSIHDLIDQLTTVLGTNHHVVDLANAFFSIAIAAENQDQFAFTWEGHQWMFQVLPKGYLYSPTICHGLVAGDLEKWPHPTSVKLFHYIDDVLLTSDSFADLEQCAPKLIEHLESCGWAVNATKIQGPILSVKFW